jgi:hypothetical protein
MVDYARGLGYEHILVGIGNRPIGYSDRYADLVPFLSRMRDVLLLADAVIIPWGAMLGENDHARKYWEQAVAVAVRKVAPSIPILQAVSYHEWESDPGALLMDYAGGYVVTDMLPYNTTVIPTADQIVSKLGLEVNTLVLPVFVTSPYFRTGSGHKMFDDRITDSVISRMGFGIRLTGWGTQLGRNKRPVYPHEISID